jgi:hypothetical protein
MNKYTVSKKAENPQGPKEKKQKLGHKIDATKILTRGGACRMPSGGLLAYLWFLATSHGVLPSAVALYITNQNERRAHKWHGLTATG